MKKRLLSLLEAAIFYAIYYISGILGNIATVITGCIVIGFEYFSNRMQVSNSEFFEQVMSFTRSEVVLAVLFTNLIILFVYRLAFKSRDVRLGEYAGLVRPGVLNAAGAAGAGVFAFVVVQTAMLKINISGNVMEQYNAEMQWLTRGNIWLIILLSLVVAPFVEELVFRGVLLRALQRAVTPIGAVVVTSLLFGLAHGNIVQGIYSFALGILLAFVRLRSGSLWNSVAMHIAFNASNVLFNGTVLSAEGMPLWLSTAALALMLLAAGKKAPR